MLMRLRDTGIERVELAILAGTEELDDGLPRLIRNRELEAISLVGFGDGQGWYVGARKRAVTLARRHVWQSVPNGIPGLISLEKLATAP